MTPSYKKRKPRKSLRTMLIMSFLLFSMAPVVFLTGYSLMRFDQAIDSELANRLEGNAREIATMLVDFEATLKATRDRRVSDPVFLYNLSTSNTEALPAQGKVWLSNDISTSISFFSRNGRLLMTQSKTDNGEISTMVVPVSNSVYISEQTLEKLNQGSDYAFIETSTNEKLGLILLSKIVTQDSKTIGYVEQMLEIDNSFLNLLKNRMKTELILIRKAGTVAAATHPDFSKYKEGFFKNYLADQGRIFFELNLRSEPFAFISYPVKWGNNDFYVAIGVSKAKAKAALKGVNYAFFMVLAAIIFVLILSVVVVSKNLLKPLEELVQASQDLPEADELIEIPIKSDSEIGLLTDSFNEASRQIIKVKSELKSKISELELINKELKEAQARLIHSSKMSSLGQLVAGVAHELNNPISFIYSNMSHLRDYSNRLIQLSDFVENAPEQIAAKKKELDIDYIKQDLPKLISSCEDGARRVRDIVLGLRNFSRLEGSKLVEIDIHEALDTTLNLLAGETKNRIYIHKQYGILPLVTCYGSQMNQVFMNILSNAVHAIVGTGNIWITTKLVFYKNKEMVSIAIQDSGLGISSVNLEKIFDPFFSTKTIGQGTGLGLSITYGIVEKHGGEILVKSQPSEAKIEIDDKNQESNFSDEIKFSGTEFTILIPVKTVPIP